MPATADDACPRCRYSQAGLPVRHRCPECGLGFDEHFRIWQPNWVGTPMLILILIALLTVGAVLQLGGRWMAPSVDDLWRLTVPGIVLVFAGFWLLMFWRTDRRGRCLAIMANGVFVRLYHTERFIPWEQLERVTRRRKSLLLHTSEPPDAIDVREVIGEKRDLDTCRATIEAARDAAIARASGPPG